MTALFTFPPTLMTREIAAYYLSMSLRELDSLRETHQITPVGDGRRVKYRKAELDKYVERIVERPASRG
jgi:hypothetical protein